MIWVLSLPGGGGYCPCTTHPPEEVKRGGVSDGGSRGCCKIIFKYLNKFFIGETVGIFKG